MQYSIDYQGLAESELGGSLSIGNAIVPANNLDQLKVDFESDHVTPYLGIGWGNKVRKDRGFAFNADLGLISVEDPDVTLSAISNTGEIGSADLQREADDIIDDFGGVSVTGSVGVSYHF
jgi:hypothetical protein